MKLNGANANPFMLSLSLKVASHQFMSYACCFSFSHCQSLSNPCPESFPENSTMIFKRLSCFVLFSALLASFLVKDLSWNQTVDSVHCIQLTNCYCLLIQSSMYQTCMTFNTQVEMIRDLPLKRRAVNGKNEQLLANSCTSNFNCSELYLRCTGQWDCTVR